MSWKTPVTDTRFGFVAIVGEPNVGKSTLMNAMVGAKVAIVTHKAQTTRSNLIGLATEGLTQIAFVDTPGIFETKRRLDKAMVNSAWNGVGRADIVTLMIQPSSVTRPQLGKILDQLKQTVDSHVPTVLVINKIDLVHHRQLLGLTDALSAMHDFDRIFMVSAKTGSGLDDLLAWYGANLPLGEWHYPVDQVSDTAVEILACDITREKLLMHMHQEIPYNLTVETEQWENLGPDEVCVRQNIIVNRDGHKKMIIGRKGENIKRVGIEAKQEMARLLNQKVHLFLQVKVRKNWMDEAQRYTRLGLEFPRN